MLMIYTACNTKHWKWACPDVPHVERALFLTDHRSERKLRLEPREYVYVRLDPKGDSTWDSRRTSDRATIRTHVKAARYDGFTVHSRHAVTERIGASVAASGRPKLMRLISQLKSNDALIVYKLDGFGRDAADILKTVRLIHSKGVEPFCASLHRPENLFNDTDFIKTMTALAELEHAVTKEREEARAKGFGVAGGRIGRPPSLDDATQSAVRADLKAGEAIATVARRYNTSRQTVMRVRDGAGRT